MPGSSILTLTSPGWGCPPGEMGRDTPANCQGARARRRSPVPPPGVREVLVTDCDDEVSGPVPIMAFPGSYSTLSVCMETMELGGTAWRPPHGQSSTSTFLWPWTSPN